MSSKPAVGKRKLKQVEEAVFKKIGTGLNVTESDFETPDSFELTNDIQTKADYYFLIGIHSMQG